MGSSVGIIGILVALLLLTIAVKIIKNFKALLFIIVAGIVLWFLYTNKYISLPSKQSTIQTTSTGATVLGKIKDMFESTAMQWQDLQHNLELASKTFRSVQDSSFIIQANKIIQSQNKLLPTNQAVQVDLPTTQEYAKLSLEQQKTVQTSFLDVLRKITPEVQQKNIYNDPVPENVKVLKQGLLTNEYLIDSAQGLITIYRQESGLLYLYIQELEVSNGPDLEIYLAEIDQITQKPTDEFYYIANLKGISGNQLYVLPSTTPIDALNTFFIYTPLTATVYAAAPLR